jgi:hypothetical protein
LLPFWTELPWFGPSGASFIPATHPDRCRVEWRSRPAHLGRRRLGLDGREHGSTLDWHGAKQACQHQPSNDVADAPSMCVIVLTSIRTRPTDSFPSLRVRFTLSCPTRTTVSSTWCSNTKRSASADRATKSCNDSPGEPSGKKLWGRVFNLFVGFELPRPHSRDH